MVMVSREQKASGPMGLTGARRLDLGGRQRRRGASVSGGALIELRGREGRWALDPLVLNGQRWVHASKGREEQV